ncbi:MAG: aminotransferase class I/II-fold pyridoxal phosphate-dependent enzyme [Vicinamibacterales bacterium]
MRFAQLAASGYYNRLTFHRVVPNGIIQGGSPGANEYSSDAPYMRDEVGQWPHVRGALGISTRGRDTGDAQIFIDLVDNPRYDHTYTVFAQVLNGMDVVDRIIEGDVIESVDDRTVRFSHRIPPSLDANELSRTVARLRAAGAPLVDLTESNPTRAGFEYPDDLLAPLADPRGLAYRPDALGLIDARHAVADDFARRGITMTVDHLALTASTSEAYSLLFKVLCDPGDEVLIPQPSYPLFEHLTRLDAVEAVAYRLDYHGRWVVDIASVEHAISDRTRALLLVNPNNPTGNFVSAVDLEALAVLCAPRGIAIISDEVFADYELVEESAVPRGQLAGRDDVLGFTLGGLSKTVGLPQVKLGWIGVSGPGSLVDATMPRLELACDTYLSVSTPVQLAASALLDRGRLIRHRILERVRANLTTCARLVHDSPSCSLLHAEGGWYAVLRVPTLMAEEELMLSLLRDDSVLVHAGYFFDFPHESFLVVSLLPVEPLFADGVSRVLARFRTATAA